MREIDKQPETEDIVKLKPILGVRPGVYLSFLYLIIILTFLFFLLVFPGIKNPGSVLQVKTEPVGAAIRVNGTYMGTYRETIFVPKGVHTIQAVLPGFEMQSAVFNIPGRVFASLFFPRRYPVDFTLKTNNAEAVLTQAAGEFAAWSFGGEPTAAWQIPLSLSEGVYRIGNESIPYAADILQAASRFTVTRAALRDITRAKVLLGNEGLSPFTAGLTGSVFGIFAFLSENPGSAAWLSNLLPPESAAIVKASAWYKNELNAPAAISAAPVQGRLELAGLVFTGISGSGFMVSETTVPRIVFETFLNENHSWRNEETSDFLISWYAANAFCQWLTGRLPLSMVNTDNPMEVRLPTEAEWELAFLSGIVGSDTVARSWEWCADPFAPLTFIKASPKAVNAVGSPERTLRSRPSQTAIEGRASLPGYFSSPSVTFRPVIAQRSP
jgi:hypothetical protein